MDTELDHGPIIVQQEIKIYDYETSFDVYKRIQELEIALLKEHLEILISGKYTCFLPTSEGNVNYSSDFKRLCHLDLSQKGTFADFLNILRATTFEPYNNAYFYDNQGNKIFVSVNLKK